MGLLLGMPACPECNWVGRVPLTRDELYDDRQPPQKFARSWQEVEGANVEPIEEGEVL